MSVVQIRPRAPFIHRPSARRRGQLRERAAPPGRMILSPPDHGVVTSGRGNARLRPKLIDVPRQRGLQIDAGQPFRRPADPDRFPPIPVRRERFPWANTRPWRFPGPPPVLCSVGRPSGVERPIWPSRAGCEASGRRAECRPTAPAHRRSEGRRPMTLVITIWPISSKVHRTQLY